MSRELRLPPSAASLSASMRDIGYSLETAIADLVDNSISAGAEKIDIYCISDTEKPTLAILDNGRGMGDLEIIHAMQHGGSHRIQERSPHDLGKFGLGLKTASFSQCRCLTVISRQEGQINGAEWNLDVVDHRDDWIVSILSLQEIRELPFIDKLPLRGTLILWRNPDRLFGDSVGKDRQRIINRKLAAVTQHLALVFHRFMEGDVSWCDPLKISVNGHPVKPFDPFCRNHTATQRLPLERISIDSREIRMQGYILPHHSKLSVEKFDLYKDYSGFYENQGVYVYRNRRLVSWGGWFRLIPKNKSTQLARVQIDFPSKLDRWWTIDIKKSRVQPPRAVRDRLSQILDIITTRSKRVYTERTKPLNSEKNSFPLWQRYPDSTHGIRYALNTDHPMVTELNQQLNQVGRSQLKLLLDMIGQDLPVERISIDWNDNPKQIYQLNQKKESIVERIQILRKSLPKEFQHDTKIFEDFLQSTCLFDHYWNIVEDYLSEDSE